MFGPDILVTPVLNVNEHVTTAYIPPLHGGDVGWYDLWSGAEEHRSGVTDLETTTYQISTHVKAGSIIPMLVSQLEWLCIVYLNSVVWYHSMLTLMLLIFRKALH